MKFLTFFMLIAVTGVSAKSYSQPTKFSFDFDNVTVSHVFREIERNSDYILIYNEKTVAINRKVTVMAVNDSIEPILNKLFTGTKSSYQISGRQIVISESESAFPANDTSTYNEEIQQFTVSGTVTDQQGLPIIGLTVVVKGTTIGALTDGSGKYTLTKIPQNAILVFTYVGMTPQEIPLNGQARIDVVMTEATLALEEVVVIGYGVQKKESVVGSIAVVSAKDLERRGGTYNLAQAISGQLGGVTVMEKTGEPGREDPEILIRGKSTWNGSQPLILVDGIERRMSDVDINEVANISVLKDASATAVFGVKGANGVILVTTKRGEIGKPQLSLSASNGWKTISKINSIMEAFEGQSWRNAAVEREVAINEASWAYYIPYEQLSRSKKPQVEPYTYLYPNVNWKDVMLKDFAKNSRYNLNLSGGTEFAKYFASVGYIHEGDLLVSQYNEAKGYDPGYAYDRFNFRGNIDFNLTKTTILSSNLSGYLGTRKEPASNFGGEGAGHIFRGFYFLAPDAFPVQYPDGRYGKDPADLNLNNPIALLQEGGTSVSNRRQISTDIKLDQKLDIITKGLSVAATISYDTYVLSTGPGVNDGGNQGQALYTYIKPAILDAKTHQDTLNSTFYYASYGSTGINDFDFFLRPWTTSSESVDNDKLERALFYQVAANYARVFGKHYITGLFLFNRRQNATGAEFANYREDWVGRATYNFRDKYFVDVNGAYNGSEKFSSKYRFGFFPSMALGWMVSKESFMQKFNWLTKFKLRGSIGQVGSDAGIPRWGYVGSWTYPGSGISSSSYFYDANGTIIASPYKTYREGTIPNPGIRWETVTKRNIGAEIAILERLVTIDVDLFKDSRKNIFLTADRRNVPNFFGAGAVPANLGATETKGYEIELGVNKTWSNKLGFWMKAGISRATDLVTMSEDPQLLPAYQKVVGFQIGQTTSQIRTGFMNNWDDVFASVPAESNMTYRLPGDWDINDFNGDGIINNYDAAPFAYPQRPQNTYNTSLGFSYKGLNLMVQFLGVTNINLSPYIQTPELTRWVAVSEELRDYWTPQNTDAYYKAPRLTTSSATGDWAIQDASYLRLKTVEISYTLPSNLTKVAGISNCRLYLNGNNLFLWSDFPADFETGSVVLGNSYPTYKIINLGIDISF